MSETAPTGMGKEEGEGEGTPADEPIMAAAELQPVTVEAVYAYS